jgi:hypothetical protein
MNDKQKPVPIYPKSQAEIIAERRRKRQERYQEVQKQVCDLLHIHNFKTVRDTGKHSYQQCGGCKKRRVISADGGYQPVDTKWLRGE